MNDGRRYIYITSKKKVIVAQVLQGIRHVVTYNLDGTEKSKACPEGRCGNAHDGFWQAALQDPSVGALVDLGEAVSSVTGDTSDTNLSDLVG